MPIEDRSAAADLAWLAHASQSGGQHWVGNAPCHVAPCRIGAYQLPLSGLSEARHNDSYVASLRSAWVRYPRAEAGRHVSPRLSPLVQGLAVPAASALQSLIHLGRLDQAAILGNYLLSTQLLPDALADGLPEALPEWQQQAGNRPLALRSVCPQRQPRLAAQLQASGFELIPARQVYVCDPTQATLWKHNHVRKDQRLLEDGTVDVVFAPNLQADDLPDLRRLFRQLFIDKHSPLNPDFTPEFFDFCWRSGFLELCGLRYQGRWVGVLGLYIREGWLTTPLIGYDTTLPQNLGLYRRLMALLYQQARERGLRLHLSSGADHFKRARGGIALPEFTAIHSGHLAARQRWAVRTLAALLRPLAHRVFQHL